MYIFTFNEKPSLILSAKSLLFRQNHTDEQMQTYNFEEIKQISIEHRYNANKELFIWIKVKLFVQHPPILIQVSSFHESLEEVFDILKTELHEKVKLKLPKKTQLKNLRTHHKSYKRLSVLSILLFLSLLIYHKLSLPSLEPFIKDNAQLVYQPTQGFCSHNIKIAYPDKALKHAQIKDYCALFGFWKLENVKTIPLLHLDTELSKNTANTWILVSQKLLKSKQYKKAAIALEKALYLEPDNQQALVSLSQVYTQQGDKTTAFSLAKEAVSKYPNFALAQQNIAQLYQDDDNTTAAYEHYQNASNLSASTYVYIQMAEIEKEQGFKNKALISYEKALTLSPKNPYILTQLGLAYWKTKEFLKAEHVLKRAYDVDQNESGYFLNYFEISLVTNKTISKEQKDNFLQHVQNNQKQMMNYDMLNILELSLQNKDTIEAKQAWLTKYEGDEFDWSFEEINAWLEQNNLDDESVYNLQSSIRFFVGYQQAYQLQHQGSAQ